MSDYFPIAPYLHEDTVSSSIKDVVFGRNIACRQLIKAFATHTKPNEIISYFIEWKLTGDKEKAFEYIWGKKDLDDIRRKMKHAGDLSTVKNYLLECVFILDPNVGDIARHRSLYNNEKEFSILGIVHSIHTLTSHQRIRSMITENLHPWDALICTSNASKKLVDRLMQRHLEEICNKFEFTQKEFLKMQKKLPLTPIIPLAGPCDINIDSEELSRNYRYKAKKKSRQFLKISENSFVLISVGRLSHFNKANPSILVSTLEKLAEKYAETEFLLILAGTFDSQYSSECYEELAKTCKRFKIIFLGGTQSLTDYEIQEAIKSSDIFISIADNPQETFGLSLLNALVAGTPIIASDWSGYKDIISNGFNGYLIKTYAAFSLDENCSLTRSLYLTAEVDDIIYTYLESMQVVIDGSHFFAQLERLFLCSDTREKFIVNGFQFYSKNFSPAQITYEYRNLSALLSQTRNEYVFPSDYVLKRRYIEPIHLYSTRCINLNLLSKARVAIESTKIQDFLTLEMNKRALSIVGLVDINSLILLLKASSEVSVNQIVEIYLDETIAKYIFVVLLKLGILEQ